MHHRFDTPQSRAQAQRTSLVDSVQRFKNQRVLRALPENGGGLFSARPEASSALAAETQGSVTGQGRQPRP